MSSKVSDVSDDGDLTGDLTGGLTGVGFSYSGDIKPKRFGVLATNLFLSTLTKLCQNFVSVDKDLYEICMRCVSDLLVMIVVVSLFAIGKS